MRAFCPRCNAPLEVSDRDWKVARCRKCAKLQADSGSDNQIAHVVPVEPVAEDADIPQVLPADVPEVLPAGTEDTGHDAMSCWTGTRTEGFSEQEGIVILRPEYLAFLPKSKAVNLGLALGSMFIPYSSGVGLANFIKERIAAQEKPSVKKVRDLSHDSPEQFDTVIRAATRAFQGGYWPRSQVVAARARYLLLRDAALIFRMGKTEVMSHLYWNRALVRMLKGYHSGPPPQRGMIKVVASISAFCLVCTVIAFCLWYFEDSVPFAAVLCWLGFSALPWAGVLIFQLMNRRKRSGEAPADDNSETNVSVKR
jgi:hypothetical protein